MSWGRDYYLGEEAFQLRGVLKLMYPFEKGRIADWNAIESILYHCFYTQMRVDPEEEIVLFFYNPYWSLTDRGKILEILFETFNSPGFFFVDFYKFILYQRKIPNALFIDFQDSCIFFCYYNNYKFISSIYKELDYGFRDLVEYMRRLLRQREYSFTTSAEREIVKDIVEKTCFFAMDPKNEWKINPVEFNYMLPDGVNISIKKERFLAPEMIYAPNLIGKEEVPIDVALKDLLQHDTLKELKFYEKEGKILWSGTIPNLPNFLERINKMISLPQFKIENNIFFSYQEIFEKINSVDLIGTNLFNCLITDLMYKSLGPQGVLNILSQRECEGR
jgi:actin-related protein